MLSRAVQHDVNQLANIKQVTESVQIAATSCPTVSETDGMAGHKKGRKGHKKARRGMKGHAKGLKLSLIHI